MGTCGGKACCERKSGKKEGVAKVLGVDLGERLRPYLWETAQACVAGNMPMMRPLSFLWPEDEAALACEDEYMLGDALLAAPLLEENAESRQVYLPEGEWIGFFDRKPYQGKQMICTDCDGKIPVFIRSGYEKQF